MYADIPGFFQLRSIFNSFRPDIAVVLRDVVYLCELTVCHETNLIASRDYKRLKYANIKHDLCSEFKHSDVKLHTMEVSVLGFISDCSNFTKSTTNLSLPEAICNNMTRNVINNSYNIYLNRNSTVNTC